MKKAPKKYVRFTIYILTITFLFYNCQNKNASQIEKDFIKVTAPDMSESDLKDMSKKYLEIFMSQSNFSKNIVDAEGKRIIKFPFSSFKETEVYKNNIQSLLHSENTDKRLLAYLTIAGTGDKSFEKVLLERVQTEKPEQNLFWMIIALMYTETSHTTPIFDFLVNNESLGYRFTVPIYVRLNKDSLRNTAYNRIKSDNVRAKILAAQSLAFTGENEKTEKLLKNAIKNWDYNIKGYAVYAAKELKIGHLKEVLIPLLDSAQTRRIALQTLINSPTKEDVDYLKTIVKTEILMSEGILDAFFESDKLEDVKMWLSLIKTKEIPDNYYFDIYDQPLLFSDTLLSEIHHILNTSSNTGIQSKLIKVLQDRTDEESLRIRFNYLNSPGGTIRYWTVTTFNGSRSKKVLKKLISMLKKPEQRVSAITSILINNNIDTLQTVYNNIYDTEKNKSLEWERSAIEYLTTFPQQQHQKTFVEILQNEKSDFAIRRYAVNGLANLKDVSSVDLIIEVCEKQERASSDHNVESYLIALSKLKGDKAKKYIQSFKNSSTKAIRELVDELLVNW